MKFTTIATPLLAVFLGWLFTGDWLIAASILVLVLVWTVLRADEGPPVLAMAVTIQWLAVTVGVFYIALTGRPLQASLMSDYQPMVLIGLGCVLALTGGLAVGQYLIRRLKPVTLERPENSLSFNTLFGLYVVGSLVVGFVQQLSQDYPSIAQALIALSYIRLALLYLVLRRLMRDGRLMMVGGILAVEVGVGITGFFAGFREPLIIAVLAMLEVFERRNIRHWFALGAIGVVMVGLGVMWLSVRVNYRERVLSDVNFAANQSQRLTSIQTAAGEWLSRDSSKLAGDVDAFVDRLWAVYYPALAVARVPNVLPHTDGSLMTATVQHLITPRVFFPDKKEVGSDSDMVRKYSGVWVAGADEGTSIAFGYAAESYVDYGVPVMFVPVFVYGVLIGVIYAGLLRLIRHRDMAVAITTVICWLSLYLFERSWAKTIGLAGTLLIYVGGVCLVLDRLWYERFRSNKPSDWRPSPQFVDRRAS